MPDAEEYEIRLRDLVDARWESYFEPFTIETGENGTILRGPIHDQAQLLGILMKISSLGLRLVSVNPVKG